MDKLTIVSDGTAARTYVRLDNRLIPGVSHIELQPITPGGVLRAVITVDAVALNLTLPADQVLLQKLEGSAPEEEGLAP